MNKLIIRKTNLFGAWCGFYYCALLLIGWWLVAGYFPLHDPSAGKEEIAAFYQEGDLFGIKLGMVILMWSAAIFLFYAATLADFVEQIEGRSGPLTKVTLMAGYANAMLTFYPPLWWIANTFRPEERSAELIYFINDAAWLQFIGGLSLIMPLFVILAIVAFSDKSEDPVFPRWFGYLSVWTFILFLPDQLLFFFKEGPFAWDGLFAFWVPLTVFCGWFLVSFYLMRKALLKESDQ